MAWAYTPIATPAPAAARDCLQRSATLASVTGVFVAPDDGYEPVLDELDTARCRVDVAAYLVTDETIANALIATDQRGVDVRLLLEEYPYGMYGDQSEVRDRLEAGGVEVRWSPSRFVFSHAKYMVVDNEVAVIMSHNLTRSAFNDNREYGTVTTESTTVEELSRIFGADWDGSRIDASGFGLVVSPDTSRTRILSLIGDARATIDVYAEVFRDVGIASALSDAERRGVTVRLITNDIVEDEDVAALETLESGGVEIRVLDRLYVHTKMMIIDDGRALIGSQNYTSTSMDENREIGVIVSVPSALVRVNAGFERDWIQAVPVRLVDA